MLLYNLPVVELPGPKKRSPQACEKGCGDVGLHEEHCPACGSFHGFPNVKMAVSELASLEAARDRAMSDRPEVAVELAELRRVASSSQVAINVSYSFAHQLVKQPKLLFTSYESLVAADARRPADLDHDRQRVATDALLYGSNFQSIVFGALTPDGHGLSSYGPVSLVLREDAISDRASVLDENSFTFVQRHKVGPDRPPPPGHRSTWAMRGDLAITKLATKIEVGMTADQLKDLVITRGASRFDDDFFEVHLFRGFSHKTVERILFSTPPDDEVDRVIRDYLQGVGATEAVQQ